MNDLYTDVHEGCEIDIRHLHGDNEYEIQRGEILVPYYGDRDKAFVDANEDDWQTNLIVNTEKEVCPRCHGEGKHSNPAIDGNGITQSEMYELGEDFRDDYFSGAYDVRCEECNGNNVIDAPSETGNPAWVMKYIEEHAQEEADDRNVQYMEMMAGA